MGTISRDEHNVLLTSWKLRQISVTEIIRSRIWEAFEPFPLRLNHPWLLEFYQAPGIPRTPITYQQRRAATGSDESAFPVGEFPRGQLEPEWTLGKSLSFLSPERSRAREFPNILRRPQWRSHAPDRPRAVHLPRSRSSESRLGACAPDNLSRANIPNATAIVATMARASLLPRAQTTVTRPAIPTNANKFLGWPPRDAPLRDGGAGEGGGGEGRRDARRVLSGHYMETYGELSLSLSLSLSHVVASLPLRRRAARQWRRTMLAKLRLFQSKYASQRALLFPRSLPPLYLYLSVRPSHERSLSPSRFRTGEREREREG